MATTVEITRQLQYTFTTKEDIKDAINEKGIEVTDDIPFGDYGDKIRQINGGTSIQFKKATARTITTITAKNLAGVTEIGNHAFHDCQLLTSVTIPSSITSIGDSAFEGCSSLKTIVFEEGSQLASIGSRAFIGCPIETAVIPVMVCTHIPKDHLKNVTIISGTSIDAEMFSDCTSLISVTIGDSITSIGASVFSGCYSLESLTIPFVGNRAGVTESDTYQYPLGYLFGTAEYDESTATEQHYYGSSTTDTTTTTYYIPDTLRSVTVTGGDILRGAFQNCSHLTNVITPNSATGIGRDAFYACNSLTNVIIGNSVVSIGSFAFRECASLTNITIPEGVVSIKGSAFEDCSSLVDISIPSSIVLIGDDAFLRCSSLQYNVYDNAKYLGNANNPYVVLMEATDTSITSCNIHLDTKVIYDSAFSNCYNFADLIIPDSVTCIGAYAFENCGSLTSVVVPDNVRSIGDGVFLGCSSLADIFVGNQCNSIGDQVLAGCDSLESIAIAEGNSVYHSAGNCIIETASKTLIAGCKSSVIPDDGSVTVIGMGAFVYCETLTNITIPDDIITIDGIAFNSCTSLTNVLFGENSQLTNIGIWAFYYCSSLTNITLPEGVTNIGSGAFIGCSSLESVTVLCTTPPTLQDANVFISANNYPIYVPAGSVNNYKTATNWSAYADRIFPIQSTYNITTTVNHGTYSGDTTITQSGTATVNVVADYGYELPSSITVTGATYLYNSTTGDITLSAPTGDVTISVTCEEIIPITYTITISVVNGTYTGATSIVQDGTATVTISADYGHTLPSTVSVIGATYTYDSTTGVISLSNPVDDVTISAACAPITYTITASVEHGTYTGSSTIQYGSTATVTVTADQGYELPTSITVTGATSNYDRTTGVITLSNPTGNVSISVICEEATPAVYTITTSVDHGSYSGSSSIQQDGTATVNVTAETGYKLPSSITVTNATYSYDSTAGVISLSAPTGNVSIIVVCVELQTYSITTSVSGGTYSGATTIKEGGSATVTVTADPDYDLPANINVTGASYTYTISTGSIVLSNPTDNVSISVTCTQKPQLVAPTISVDGNNLLITDDDGNATSFDMYVDDAYVANVVKG